jgi:hypothetical protein
MKERIMYAFIHFSHSATACLPTGKSKYEKLAYDGIRWDI